MNIWVVGRSYPTKQNKMRGSFELEQAQLLARGGHHVTYVAAVFHPVNKIEKWGFCSFKDGQVHVYVESVPFAPERMHIHLSKFQGSIWRRLLEKVESEQGVPDIIHIHYPGMVSVPEPVLQYKSKGTYIVTTDHWTKTLQNTMDSFQRKQLIKYAQEADCILCVGQPLKKAIQKITGTKKVIKVVPNVVSDLFQISKSTSEKGYFEFIAVGRLAPVKQMDKIALAFAETFKGEEQVRLTIVGDGSVRKNIESIIESHNMQKQITLTGTLSREETADRVSKADVLICFSRLETFGVPVIEAWACGKPVIASDCLGFLEYWDNRLGFIVPHDNIEELKEKMITLHDNFDSYDSMYISEFAKNTFGEQAIFNQLTEIYHSLTKR